MVKLVSKNKHLHPSDMLKHLVNKVLDTEDAF